jgi:surfeit locus 1 family protein
VLKRSQPSLLLPGFFVSLGVLLLLGLGTWQVYRLHWKEGILAEIAAAESHPPAPLTEHPPEWGRVTVSGRFRYDKAVRIGLDVRDTTTGSVMGHDQLVPLERDGAPALLVDRGWIPETKGTPVDEPAGPVSVTGYIRQGEHPAWFSPADDVAGRQFYVLDPPAIAKAMDDGPVEPFALIVLGTAADGHYPVPAADFPRPPNNHLSYAITWYSLAIVLVVMFIIRIRAKPDPA